MSKIMEYWQDKVDRVERSFLEEGATEAETKFALCQLFDYNTAIEMWGVLYDLRKHRK